MTGEMGYIDPETGEDSNGESWPVHLAVAKAVGGELRAFDVYQGPYIDVPRHGKMWVGSDDGVMGYVYYEHNLRGHEDFRREFYPMRDESAAADAALDIMREMYSDPNE